MVMDPLHRELVRLLGDQDILSIFVVGPVGSGKHFLVKGAIDKAGLRDSVYSVIGTPLSFRLPYGAIQYLLSGLPDQTELSHATVFAELFRVFSRHDPKKWLVIENAAFIDRATLAVLSQLVIARKIRVVIFGEQLSALPQELAILSSLPSWAKIEIARVSREELRDIVYEATGIMPCSYLTAVLYAASQGRLGVVRALLQKNMELGRILVRQGILVIGREGLHVERTTQHSKNGNVGPLSVKQQELLSGIQTGDAQQISLFSPETRDNLDRLIDSGAVILDPDLPEIHHKFTRTKRTQQGGNSSENAGGIPANARLSAERDSRFHTADLAAKWIEETTDLLTTGHHAEALGHFRKGPTGGQRRTGNRTRNLFDCQHAALASAVLACNGKTVEADQYLDLLMDSWGTLKNSYGSATNPILADFFHSNVMTAAILLGRWPLARRIIDRELDKLDPANYSLAKGLEAMLNVVAGDASGRTLDELHSNVVGKSFPFHAEIMESVLDLGRSLEGSQATMPCNIIEESRKISTGGYSALKWWSVFLKALTNSSDAQSQDDFLKLASEAAQAGDSVARLHAVACAVRNGHFQSVPLMEELAQMSNSASARGFHQVAIALKTQSQWDLVTGMRTVARSGFGLYASDWCNRFYSRLSGPPLRAALRIGAASADSCPMDNGTNDHNSALRRLLTKSEFRVATSAARGMSNREIARQEAVSVRTVEGHLYQTYSKLNVSDRKQLSQIVHTTVPGNSDQHD